MREKQERQRRKRKEATIVANGFTRRQSGDVADCRDLASLGVARRMEGKSRDLGRVPRFPCQVWIAELIAWCVLFPLLLPIMTVQDVPRNSFAGVFWGFIQLWRFFSYGLAVARLANLGNDYFHEYCRTPRENRELHVWHKIDAESQAKPKTTFEEFR